MLQSEYVQDKQLVFYGDGLVWFGFGVNEKDEIVKGVRRIIFGFLGWVGGSRLRVSIIILQIQTRFAVIQTWSRFCAPAFQR
jgi:hypothetical protein